MLGLIPTPALGANKPASPGAPSDARVTEDGNAQIRITQSSVIRTTEG